MTGPAINNSPYRNLPGQVFLVGGAVRDCLIGLPIQDRDWAVVGATPDQMIAAGFKPVGKDFPVFLDPIHQEEYALARTERKTGQGYMGFTCNYDPGVTLEEDLARRDLTINAIAMSDDGELIDPYGGASDLRSGILRHVGPAFVEDPVRILRIARLFARYQSSGFVVAPETLALMREMVDQGEVDALSPDRVWKELSRALGESSPSAFFEVLKSCGALARIMPEVDALFGVPQPVEHHPEVDTGLHTMMVLEQARKHTDDPNVLLAALLHDLGKAETPEALWPKHHGHETAGLDPIRNLCKRVGAPKLAKQLALTVAENHTRCHKAMVLRPGKIHKLLSATKAFTPTPLFENFLLCCKADAQGRTGFEGREYPQVDRLRTAQSACLTVSTRDIAEKGYTGKAFGEELRRRQIQAIDSALAETPMT